MPDELHYRAVRGLNWPPHIRREPGEDVSDLAPASLAQELADGTVEVYDPATGATLAPDGSPIPLPAALLADLAAAADALDPPPAEPEPDPAPVTEPESPALDPDALPAPEPEVPHADV